MRQPWFAKMDLIIDDAGQDQAALRVDFAVGAPIQRRADGLNESVFYEEYSNSKF